MCRIIAGKIFKANAAQFHVTGFAQVDLSRADAIELVAPPPPAVKAKAEWPNIWMLAVLWIFFRLTL